MLAKLIKIILYFFTGIIILIIGIIAFVYYTFNNYTFNDEFAIEQDYLKYYNENYSNARIDFIKQSELLKEKFPLTQIGNLKVPSAIDTSLYIDYCYLPSLQDSSKLMIISSGVHGVEAYTGSAFQQLLMQNYVNTNFLNKSGLLLIHSINPYGFKYDRRVSENNIDLNRNCSSTKELYKTIYEGYPKVNELINPTGLLDLESSSKTFFFITAIKEIIKSSMPVLRQAVLQGQYKYGKGLYFGGFKAEPQIDSLIPIIKSIAQPYESIFAIDVHTGYGQRGKLHLFPNPVDKTTQDKMEKLFSGYQIDWGDSDEFYTVTGDFINLLKEINSDKDFIPMTIEFGTMDSQTTLGSLKSLQITIAENQGYHYGFQTEQDKTKINGMFLEMYNPSSPAWKSQCISESKLIIEQVFPRYMGDE